MTVFQPAYTIRYKEHVDDVIVQSHSIDGRAHTTPPQSLKHASLPIFLFQLADAGYTIVPGNHNPRESYKELNAYSPEFAQRVRERAMLTTEPGKPY